jgi:glycosyltransferase involved in cell wall biosynthesis
MYKAGLVSIIIPAYNASSFITETIGSIKAQTYALWEVIVVNDGSTDNTAGVIKQMQNDRIQLIEQQNAGVSEARNKGLDYSQGEYIVFFDADDLMTPAFLEARVNALVKDPKIGFVGGLVETFPERTNTCKAVAAEPQKEIFFFEKLKVTIPSNYLFRKILLMEKGVRFNPALSSTADRFFILQLSQYAKGIGLETEEGKLLYRVSESSMSHKVTPKLMRDNVQFYEEVKKKGLLPVQEAASFRGLYFFSLGLGFAKTGAWLRGIKYLALSFFNQPFSFLSRLMQKIKPGTNQI